ncbi:MAG: C40 family peptidase [Hornefia sp.]|nr:C40 family peptidase [Hornefia sp.]
MKANSWKEKLGSFVKSKKIIPIIIFEIVIFSIAVIGVNTSFAAEDYWQLRVADNLVGTVRTEEQAKKILSSLEKTYVNKGAKDVDVDLTPRVDIKHSYYGYVDKKPKISDEAEIREAFSKLTKDNTLKIRTSQIITKVEKVKHKVIKKKDNGVLLNTAVEKMQGRDGENVVTIKQISTNGKIDKAKVMKTSQAKESKAKVVLFGTAVKSAGKGVTSSNLGEAYSKKSGQAVADFALKFVGNPYKYGGESLTNGADCSGFVMAVYRHFGVLLPHSSIADQYLGKGVSFSQARPGDLICYGGHIGIYIGNNKIVHAMDEAHGITVSRIGYNGKPITTVRRIFG